ncbi:hypothetical protein [Tissierella sp.]|nr:hypothetical protein [Tissierella sp.]MDR7856319.1 hypothetical protein [Tissierella sp.]
MRYHRYKNKHGGYYRGRSRYGRYYTRPSGCLLPILIFTVAIATIISLLI